MASSGRVDVVILMLLFSRFDVLSGAAIWIKSPRSVCFAAGRPRPEIRQQKIKSPPVKGRADALSRLVALYGATSAFAIHLARVGRLAWASTHFLMLVDCSFGTKLVSIGFVACVSTAVRDVTAKV